jgi:predicted phosphoribosyltransferase
VSHPTDVVFSPCHIVTYMFENRTAAGERLADALDREDIHADVVVAIPRGGLPVGRPVADRLGVPLGVVVASKIGAPGNPEYALGAVAEDGTVCLDDDVVERLGVEESYLARERDRERAVAEEKAESYRGGPRPSFTGERVVVVDDGVATGATMRACLQLAVPVGPPDTLSALAEIADRVVAVERPARFRAVGAHYRDFDQVSDEEAIGYLDGR